MAEQLVPVVVVMKDTDLEYLNSINPGCEYDETFKQVMERNGWTEEALMIGSLLAGVCDLIRRGDMTWGHHRE